VVAEGRVARERATQAAPECRHEGDDASIVNDDVEPAQYLLCRLRQAVRIGAIKQIARKACIRFNSRDVTVGRCDFGSFAAQLAHNGGSNSTRSPRHQRYFSLVHGFCGLQFAAVAARPNVSPRRADDRAAVIWRRETTPSSRPLPSMTLASS